PKGRQPDEAQVIRHCEARLGAYKVPRLIEFRDSLPRTGTGKIAAKVLQAEELGRGWQAGNSQLPAAGEGRPRDSRLGAGLTPLVAVARVCLTFCNPVVEDEGSTVVMPTHTGRQVPSHGSSRAALRQSLICNIRAADRLPIFFRIRSSWTVNRL